MVTGLSAQNHDEVYIMSILKSTRQSGDVTKLLVFTFASRHALPSHTVAGFWHTLLLTTVLQDAAYQTLCTSKCKVFCSVVNQVMFVFTEVTVYYHGKSYSSPSCTVACCSSCNIRHEGTNNSPLSSIRVIFPNYKNIQYQRTLLPFSFQFTFEDYLANSLGKRSI